MKGLMARLTSLRTTALLLALLVLLLLLSILLPQEKTLGPEAFGEILDQGGVKRFFLGTLGLGTMATSPLFLALLGLFFLNLLLVLIKTLGPTLKRASATRTVGASGSLGIATCSATPGARRPTSAPIPLTKQD